MDLDRIIYERDIGTVDKHIDTVINYIIEPTDVLILDKSFVKIFRLAQLAIEYLLCCKRHLDTNVAILKNELIKLQQVRSFFFCRILLERTWANGRS